MVREQEEGVLPSGHYLTVNGRRALAMMMWKYPEKFAHIKQTSKHGTVEQWVAYAEKLEKKYELYRF